MDRLLPQFRAFMGDIFTQNLQQGGFPFLRLDLPKDPDDVAGHFYGGLITFQYFYKVDGCNRPDLNQGLTGVLPHPLVFALLQDVEEGSDGADLKGCKNRNDGSANLFLPG